MTEYKEEKAPKSDTVISLITAAHILAPNDISSIRWQQLYLGY